MSLSRARSLSLASQNYRLCGSAYVRCAVCRLTDISYLVIYIYIYLSIYLSIYCGMLCMVACCRQLQAPYSEEPKTNSSVFGTASTSQARDALFTSKKSLNLWWQVLLEKRLVLLLFFSGRLWGHLILHRCQRLRQDTKDDRGTRTSDGSWQALAGQPSGLLTFGHPPCLISRPCSAAA